MNYIRTITPFPYEDSIYEASTVVKCALERAANKNGTEKFVEAEMIVRHIYDSFLEKLNNHITQELLNKAHEDDPIDCLIRDEADIHNRRALKELAARRDKAIKIITNKFVEAKITEVFAENKFTKSFQPSAELKNMLMNAFINQSSYDGIASMKTDITAIVNLAADILGKFGNINPGQEISHRETPEENCSHGKISDEAMKVLDKFCQDMNDISTEVVDDHNKLTELMKNFTEDVSFKSYFGDWSAKKTTNDGTLNVWYGCLGNGNFSIGDEAAYKIQELVDASRKFSLDLNNMKINWAAKTNELMNGPHGKELVYHNI